MRADGTTRDRREAGFTLVELLVAMTLMVLVLGAGFTLLQVVVRSEPEARTANASIQDAQIVTERMARELRMTYQVNSATANSLSVNTYLQPSSTRAPAAPARGRSAR